jgi:glycosyltransferase involved in cell wall biosynthesis
MRIAFLGSRGIPACYSGFETFYEQLATRLVLRGHEVTVYNRSGFIRDVMDEYRGVRIVSLPSIQTKHLDTITHTLLSCFHALFQRYDIVYTCIVGNSPLVWIPRLSGAKTLLNVDGKDWAREKWSGFARWYQQRCERVASTTSHVIISDARGIQERYKRLYGFKTIYVPYGANTIRDDGLETLDKWGLKPDEYILYVGRLVPENAIHLLIQAFKRVDTDKRLVIVGDAPFVDAYRRQLRDIADKRIIFTGYAFGKDYAQLSSHCYLYVQPSGIDGTRPALLDQMGFSNCVLVRNSRVNMEVIGDFGSSFEMNRGVEGLAEQLQNLVNCPQTVADYRKRAAMRVEQYYNWEWVADFYEELFQRILQSQEMISYDEFLLSRTSLI